MLALWMVVGVVLTVIGLSTCCIGFILFALPYVSSVVLLPVIATFRGLGPEFLAQFGTEYALFEVAPAVPVADLPPRVPGSGT